MRLTFAALAACLAFLSMAMAVAIPENPKHCALYADGISNNPVDYKCRGDCPAEGPQSGEDCIMTVEANTARCLCGDYPPFEGCLGEYDMNEDGVGYFCYTLQGCSDAEECDVNLEGQDPDGWWVICVCR